MKNMLTRKLIIKFSKTLTMSTIWRLFYSNKNLLSDVHMCEIGCGSVCMNAYVCKNKANFIQAHLLLIRKKENRLNKPLKFVQFKIL